jgi:hypothetical protein
MGDVMGRYDTNDGLIHNAVVRDKKFGSVIPLCQRPTKPLELATEELFGRVEGITCPECLRLFFPPVKNACPKCRVLMEWKGTIALGDEEGRGGTDLYQCPKCMNVEIK